MSGRKRKFLWAITTLVLIGFFTVIWLGLRSDSRQAHSDFQWFSTLGFPDVKGFPYVRVASGQWSQTGDDPPKNDYFNGFLLSSNSNSFKVFTLDLSTRSFTNSAGGTPEHERVGFEILDLRREATLRLSELRAPPAKENLWKGFGAQVPEEIEVFTLAWACWRQGLGSKALSLYREAEKLPKEASLRTTKETLKERLSALVETIKAHFQKGRSKDPSIREKMEKSIAHKLMWSAVLGFEDPSISRPDLLLQFEAILRNYPHTEHRERARATAAILRRMIAEDQAHAENGPKDLIQLPVAEQVRELIFRLRDQNGHQYSQPGWCDIFDDWRGVTNTAAHQLVKLGYAAVPQLIAALDSDTLTRSVGFHHDFYFSHTVLTVGDCAAAILERITGRAFFVAKSTSGYMSKDGEASDARKAAEVWWTEFQKKGELQMLVDGVKAAGNDAPAQAELLLRRYPDIATSALIQGTQAATNSWIRSRLIEELANVDASAVVAFLNHELVEGPTIETRVAAAKALRPHDKNAAVAAMIREWQNLATTNARTDEDDGVDALIGFLGGCDTVEAISALADNLSQRPVNIRLQVIEAWGETDVFPSGRKAGGLSPATTGAIESRLVTALEDTEVRTGMSESRNGKSISDPRICDMAAFFLAERWPNRYSFDISGSLKSRERQRIQCLNTWRKAHNINLVPIPQSESVHVSRSESTKVTTIEWATNSATPGNALAEMVANLKNKPLKPEDLVNLLTRFAGHPEQSASGFELNASRDEDLTGVRLLVRLIPGYPPLQTQGWDVSQHVTLGRKNLNGSSGGGILEAYTESREWEDLAEAAKQAVDGPPETPFEINVRIAAGKNTSITLPGR